MNFINPPKKSPQGVTHHTFYSQVYNHEIGYNIYLPPGYGDSGERYPVPYHLHGWTDNESTHIWLMENICRNRRAITVFPNNSPVIEDRENLPVEDMFINELIPHIDRQYRTNADRRMISGFSMGGGMAFCYAVKYPELFSRVTAYAATFHHYFHKGYNGVGQPQENAAALYAAMMQEKRHLEEDGVLWLLRQNAAKIRGLQIDIRVGTDDVLICENEIMRLYLDSLGIAHEYTVVQGAGHELGRIL